MPLYDEIPLKKAQIRLFSLKPGTKQQQIELKLSSVLLQEDLDYAAISYCWGEPHAPRKLIRCNGFDIRITESLYGALRHLRHETEPQSLWADAICINQEDAAEKNAQVRLMRTIYKRASRVYIWLGEHSRKSLRSFRWAKNFTPGLRQVARFEIVVPFRQILERPWFHRVWIVQEMAMSGNRAYILYDALETISWLKFSEACNFYGTRIGSIQTTKYVTLLESIRTKVSGSSQGCTQLDPTLKVLSQFRDFEATDPSDKVYALLGIARADDIREQIPIDYNLDVQELYRRVAQVHLRSASLDILSVSARLDRTFIRQDLCLPSWVPDWSQSFWKHDNPYRDFAAYPDELPGGFTITHFDSTSHSDMIAEISEDGQRLHLSGLIVDSIEVLGHSGDLDAYVMLPKKRFLTFGQRLQSVRILLTAYFEAERIVKAASKGVYVHTSEDPITTVGRILLSRYETDDPEADLQKFRNWYQALDLLRFLHTLHLPKTAFIYWSIIGPAFLFNFWPKSFLLHGTPSWANISKHVRFNQRLLAGIKGRRLMKSKNSFLALVPREARVGDRILLCKGGITPTLVRKRDLNWELIGNCYVHGLHYGQFFQENASLCEDIWLV